MFNHFQVDVPFFEVETSCVMSCVFVSHTRCQLSRASCPKSHVPYLKSCVVYPMSCVPWHLSRVLCPIIPFWYFSSSDICPILIVPFPHLYTFRVLYPVSCVPWRLSRIICSIMPFLYSSSYNICPVSIVPCPHPYNLSLLFIPSSCTLPIEPDLLHYALCSLTRALCPIFVSHAPCLYSSFLPLSFFPYTSSLVPDLFLCVLSLLLTSHFSLVTFPFPCPSSILPDLTNCHYCLLIVPVPTSLSLLINPVPNSFLSSVVPC